MIQDPDEFDSFEFNLISSGKFYFSHNIVTGSFFIFEIIHMYNADFLVNQ